MPRRGQLSSVKGSALLISLVYKRPCLWDPEDRSYKDRQVKAAHWMDIFRLCIPSYDKLTEEEQRKHERSLQMRWKCMRDSHVKYLRRKSYYECAVGSSDAMSNPVRKYMFSDRLSFLDRVLQPEDQTGYVVIENGDMLSHSDESADSASGLAMSPDGAGGGTEETEDKRQDPLEMYTDSARLTGAADQLPTGVPIKKEPLDFGVASSSSSSIFPSQPLAKNTPRKKRQKRTLQVALGMKTDGDGRQAGPRDSEVVSTSSSKGNNSGGTGKRKRVTVNVVGANPDKEFFNSILPIVTRFSEDAKLEFRMEVLQLVQRIKKGKTTGSS